MANDKSIKKLGDELAFAGRTGMGFSPGMSKREFFAIEILAALASKSASETSLSSQDIITLSIRYADILISRLNEKKD